MKIKIVLFFLSVALVSMSVTCKRQTEEKTPPVQENHSLVNTSYLDYLTVPVTFKDGRQASAVYIYADAPDYHFTSADGEGYTCVDDVARAALVYLRDDNLSSDEAIQEKVRLLVSFILEMQSENGYFYNFLKQGNDINTSGVTSVNNPNWWSWRAFLTLAEGLPLVEKFDQPLAVKMKASIEKLMTVLKSGILNRARTTKNVMGVEVPEWLPAGSGTDQASIIIQALISFYKTDNDNMFKDFVRKLADGIVMMQAGDADHFPYNAFLSWENTWHAYGNEQAYTLLIAGEFLNEDSYKKTALKEIDHFYPWLISEGYKSSFSVNKTGDVYQQQDMKDYNQIAYDIKPMIFAAAEAFSITGERKYADLAGQIAGWFFGENSPGMQMYTPETGRCFDGINSSSTINKNGGAESTIEALLALQKGEQFKEIKQILDTYK